MQILKKLYNWVLSWADSKYGVLALFVLAFMESSFFPIPPDVLLMALALGKPKKSLWFATVCLLGSVTGAVAGYGIGQFLWQAIDQYFYLYVPGFTPELFLQVSKAYEEHSYMIIFTAAFTPIPYKIFTIAAGVSQISIIPFVIASILGRGARFYLVGLLFQFFGAKVKVYIEKYLNILTILFVLIYVLAFYIAPKLF